MSLGAELHPRLQYVILLLSSLCALHAVSTEHPERHSGCLQYLKGSMLVALTGLISYQPSPGIGKLFWGKKLKLHILQLHISILTLQQRAVPG